MTAHALARELRARIIERELLPAEFAFQVLDRVIIDSYAAGARGAVLAALVSLATTAEHFFALLDVINEPVQLN